MGPIANMLRTAAAPSRRGFVKLALGTASGLLIGLKVPSSGTAAATSSDAVAISPLVHLKPDGTVTVIVKHLDKGQGTATGLATLVAEELDASVEQIATEFAPANAELYANLNWGAVQGTGGSSAINNSFDQYRSAGAAAKQMLIAAAAEAWGVPAAEITVANGKIAHTASGNESGFGPFASAAALQEVPAEPALKTPDQWVYIGKEFPRVDAKAKSAGGVDLFAMDLHFDDMLTAVLITPPSWGAKLTGFDASAANDVRGFVDAFEVPSGVAVLATSTWPALKARGLIETTWDESEAETRSSADIFADYRAELSGDGALSAHEHGDVAAGFHTAVKIVEATYEFPFLAHAPMEPLNATIRFDGETADIWTGSQLQTMDHAVAAQVLGIPQEQVNLHTMWAGGSFGRRATAQAHLVAEVASIAKTWGKDQPIKLIYSREDDIQGGYYRPVYVHKARAGIDIEGKIVAWEHRIVGQSILIGTPFEGYLVNDGIDGTSVEGVDNLPYATGALKVEVTNTDLAVPPLWWRAVGHTHTAYAVETMIDELAEAAGQDPVAYRLALLPVGDRRRGVLELAAERAGWGESVTDGIARGVAVHKSFDTYVAMVADVRVPADGGPVKVERVVCAVDCGIAVNPDNIRSQIEGGLGYGLGALLRNQITLTNGRVDQANFDTYEPLRIDDMPDVAVHIVASDEMPTGVGEPGTPPIGPAVANAIANATGNRVYSLPLSKHGLV